MSERLGPYIVHPMASAFALLEGNELEALAEDIRRRGLQEPIVLTHNREVLVDGRNRYLACEIALADPVYQTLPESFSEQDILDFIVAANVKRRHLNAGQLSFIGTEDERISAKGTERRRTDTGPQ